MNYEDQYDHYLFKFNVYDTDFLIMHRSELPPLGFSSLYAITKADAEALISASTSVQFKGSVWSPHLVLDIDSEEIAVEVESKLKILGLAYDKYFTGNRGAHFYITRPHAPSHILPQLDKEWVKENFPEADTSIYSNLHLFRLKGAIHAKTGKRKVLVYKQSGNDLILANVLKVTQSDYISHKSSIHVTQSIFLDRHIMGLTVPWTNGKRHEALLNLGIMLRKRGEPLEFIERWLQNSNLLFIEPKSESEIERIMSFVSEVGID
jgi:uncharacterized protein YdhG (YjbR/CyaY superfamily)